MLPSLRRPLPALGSGAVALSAVGGFVWHSRPLPRGRVRRSRRYLAFGLTPSLGVPLSPPFPPGPAPRFVRSSCAAFLVSLRVGLRVGFDSRRYRWVSLGVRPPRGVHRRWLPWAPPPLWVWLGATVVDHPVDRRWSIGPPSRLPSFGRFGVLVPTLRGWFVASFPTSRVGRVLGVGGGLGARSVTPLGHGAACSPAPLFCRLLFGHLVARRRPCGVPSFVGACLPCATWPSPPPGFSPASSPPHMCAGVSEGRVEYSFGSHLPRPLPLPRRRVRSLLPFAASGVSVGASPPRGCFWVGSVGLGVGWRARLGACSFLAGRRLPPRGRSA